MTAEVIRSPRFSAKRLEAQVARDENVLFIRNVRRLGRIAVYGGTYQPEYAVSAGQELVHRAERRMAQIGGSFDDAA